MISCLHNVHVCVFTSVMPTGKVASVLVSSPEKPAVEGKSSAAGTTQAVAVSSSTTATGVEQLAEDSHDDDGGSQPHIRGDEEASLIGRASHIRPAAVPETVTPFVTTQHHPVPAVGGRGKGTKKEPSTGSNTQTPLGVSSKQSKGGEGLPYTITTPANLHGHTSG